VDDELAEMLKRKLVSYIKVLYQYLSRGSQNTRPSDLGLNPHKDEAEVPATAQKVPSLDNCQCDCHNAGNMLDCSKWIFP
jgi:hypothetical protein